MEERLEETLNDGSKVTLVLGTEASEEDRLKALEAWAWMKEREAQNAERFKP